MAGAQPLVRVTGSVHSTRVVTYDGGVNSKTQKPYQGGSYGEVLLLTEVSRLNGEVTDFPATLTMRVDADATNNYGKGVIVDALVTPFCDVVQARGQYFNVVGYRFAADVPAPAPTGSRAVPASSSSSS